MGAGRTFLALSLERGGDDDVQGGRSVGGTAETCERERGGGGCEVGVRWV